MILAEAGVASVSKTKRIVVVSDDEQLRSLLCGLLIAHGYAGVIGSDTRSPLSSMRSACEWDAAIVDTSVSYAEALRVLRRLRQACAAIVAIFAKKNGSTVPPELAADGGLLLVAKPFDPRALLLVIRGLFSGASDVTAPSRASVSAGPVELWPLLNRAFLASREIVLTDIETRILNELIANASRPVPRDRLARRGGLRDESPDARALDAHINRLRRKLGHDRAGRTPIRTVRGVGYLLIAQWEPPP